MCVSGSSVAGVIKTQRGGVHVFSVSLSSSSISKRPKTYPRLHMCLWLSLYLKIIKTESPKCHVDFWLFCGGVDQIIRWTVWCVLCLSLSSFSKGPKTNVEHLMCPWLSLYLKIIKSTTNMPCADLALLSRRWLKDDDKSLMCFLSFWPFCRSNIKPPLQSLRGFSAFCPGNDQNLYGATRCVLSLFLRNDQNHR